MPIAARRIFRLSLTVALTLAAAYAIGKPLPYLAPIFAIILTLSPAPPIGLKGLIGFILLVTLTTGTGLLMIPVLINYPVSGMLIVASGIYFAIFVTIHKGKGAVGSFMIMGLTLITAAGVASFDAAENVAESMILGIFLAAIMQHIVYPFFPEDILSAGSKENKPADIAQSKWIALRATIIVFPVYFVALINPSMYLSIVMKSVSLGQQASVMNTKNAGRELLGSTFLGGLFAILFWFALGIETTLWMFFLWMVLYGIFFSSKLYRLVATRFPPSFWSNVAITMMILLGPAVADSANGKDVYKAFAVRMALFVAVTVYAWASVILLEHLRTRRQNRVSVSLTPKEELS